MGYRTFKDSHGTEWQAWDVVPRLAERRVRQRRRAAAPSHGSERRRLPERRLTSERRPVLTDGLYAGWLCFEAAVEKRRLTPIPPDWQECGTDCLEEYCRQATPAGRPSAGVDVRRLLDSTN